MSDGRESAQIEQLVLFRPAQIRRKAHTLRERSRQCAVLASDCLTEDGRKVLHQMALELGGEADELENALLTIRRLYAETFDNCSAEEAEK